MTTTKRTSRTKTIMKMLILMLIKLSFHVYFFLIQLPLTIIFFISLGILIKMDKKGMHAVFHSVLDKTFGCEHKPAKDSKVSNEPDIKDLLEALVKSGKVQKVTVTDEKDKIIN